MQYICKGAHALWYSSLIIIWKTLCYLIGISRVIENDNFQRKTCCTLVSKKAKPCPQGGANLNKDTVM